jgi:hypothetical protein
MIISNKSKRLVILSGYIVNTDVLSLEAIGLTAKITYIEQNSKSHNDAVLKVWKMVSDHGYDAPYRELVDRGVINDILEDLRYER